MGNERTRRPKYEKDAAGRPRRYPSNGQPPSGYPQRARRSEIRRWVSHVILGIAATALIVAFVLSQLSTVRAPEVLLEARSYAVVFLPSENIDLVQNARPRFSVEPGGRQFAGIGFEWQLPTLGAFDGTRWREHADTTSVNLVQSLHVSAGCTVRLEHWVDRLVRLKVERLPSTLSTDTAATCSMYAELLRYPDGDTVIARDIDGESALDVTFATSAPVRLRNIPVSELRFETEDAGRLRSDTLAEPRLQSAIIGATLSLPKYTSDKAHQAHLGDVVKLGKLDGEIVELSVGDTMRTIYRGRADDPRIADMPFRPSLLKQLNATENFRLAVIFFVSLLGLVFALFQAVLK